MFLSNTTPMLGNSTCTWFFVNIKCLRKTIGRTLFNGVTIKDCVINININPSKDQPPSKRYIIYNSNEE